MKAFDISASSVQWLTTGFLLVNGIMIPITAWLINKFSSRNLYLSAMTIFLIGTITCFVAPNFSTLLIGRLVQAAGVGSRCLYYKTLCYRFFHQKKEDQRWGWLVLLVGLAPALGPNIIWLDH